MANIQQQIEKELPQSGMDALLVLGGAVGGQVIGNTFKPTAGKTDAKPFLLILLAFLVTVFIKNKSARMIAIGLIVHQGMKLLFRDATLGKAVLAGVPKKALGKPNTLVLPANLTWYDDRHLRGLGCPTCGGTCGQAKSLQMLASLGCCDLVGLGGIEQYLTATQMSDIRSRCPALEQKGNDLLNQAYNNGQLVLGVTYSISGSVCQVNVSTQTIKDNNGQPVTTTQLPAGSVAVGDLVLFAECYRKSSTSKDINVSLKEWDGNQFIPVEVGSKYKSATLTVKGGNTTYVSMQIANGQSVSVNKSLTAPEDIMTASVDIVVNGITRKINQTIACKDVQYGNQAMLSAQVTMSSQPVNAPTSTTPPSSTPTPSSIPSSVNILTSCKPFGVQRTVTISLFDTVRESVINAGQGGYGESFVLSLYDSNNSLIGRRNLTINNYGMIRNDFIVPTEITNEGNMKAEITGTYNGSPFKVTSAPFDCGEYYTPPTSTPTTTPPSVPTTTTPPITCANGTFSVSNKAPVAGEVVQFTVTNPQAGNTYAWDFGDSTTDKGTSVQKVYNGNGNFFVRLTTNCQNGSTPQSGDTIAVKAQPKPMIMVSSVAIVPDSGICTPPAPAQRTSDVFTPTSTPYISDGGGTSTTTDDFLPRGWVYSKGVRSGCENNACKPCATTCKPCITDACSSYRNRINPRHRKNSKR